MILMYTEIKKDDKDLIQGGKLLIQLLSATKKILDRYTNKFGSL